MFEKVQDLLYKLYFKVFGFKFHISHVSEEGDINTDSLGKNVSFLRKITSTRENCDLYVFKTTYHKSKLRKNTIKEKPFPSYILIFRFKKHVDKVLPDSLVKLEKARIYFDLHHDHLKNDSLIINLLSLAFVGYITHELQNNVAITDM